MRKGNRRIGYTPNNEYYTPPHIFEALGLEFDLDPCSPEQGSHVPAKQCYSLPFDGLAAPWFGLVWVNPPYSEVKPWVNKWLEHKNGFLLVPGAKSNWRLDLWNHPDTVLSLTKPPKFIRPDGTAAQIMYPVDLWAIGDVAIEALRHSGLGRMR